MSKTTNFVMFAVGATVGSVITWQYIKKKYERIAQEEIDSVKAIFLRKDSDMEVTVSDIPQQAELRKVEEKPDISEYEALMEKEGYTNYSGMGKEERASMESKPYVITPEEFGEFEEYEKISLTYYGDQVLADENDELVEDVEGAVGFESLTHFGEYEDDSVFVRNDRLKCDYEILLDQRTYSEVVKMRPHQMEV